MMVAMLRGGGRADGQRGQDAMGEVWVIKHLQVPVPGLEPTRSPCPWALDSSGAIHSRAAGHCLCLPAPPGFVVHEVHQCTHGHCAACR